jgi:hypothetical protein
VIEPAAIDAHFAYTAGLLKARQWITFTADAPVAEGRRFEWIFGDGARGEGREVRHAFPDAEGTLLDGSGRFRVLLHITDRPTAAAEDQAWQSESVVLSRAAGLRTSIDTEAVAETPAGEVFERTLHVPADGGYTFTLLTSRDATLAIDGLPPRHTPKARAQVCGAEGDAVQPLRVSVASTAGRGLRMRLHFLARLPISQCCCGRGRAWSVSRFRRAP